MLFQTLFVISLSFFVNAEEVHKKLCPNVGSHECVVHSVNVEPCPHGPRFCSFILDKRYSATVDFTPYFSAHNLMVSVSTHPQETVTFTERIYKNACQRLLTCPLEAHIRQSFDIPLNFDQPTLPNQSKFPVQVKLWNADDTSQFCCFTFKAKIK
ncbi:unnamed protein product [Diatraea saccharalis]|uniref:MD-2-related lipid-recognition domain-containing protein n=1 Tax=Diatraea saccharalis TaxID=40085 RepID=A0A9N9R236_9NEOP|nr:unnamed protein product [Diatraea saccharalis]